MSKPISFGHSTKTKPQSTTFAGPSSKLGTIKPIALPVSSTTRKAFGAASSRPTLSALRIESDDEEETAPQHEELAGFGASGAILSQPKQDKGDQVIENAGNLDWRRRGKDILPAEVRAARDGKSTVVVERNEVSKAYGLQFAGQGELATAGVGGVHDEATGQEGTVYSPPPKVMTEDERAMAALLDPDVGKSMSTATIEVQSNSAWQQKSETENFRTDVATRPDSSTLDEYASMPVEEFGMAMLRGMGRKRRANGEIIDLQKNSEEEEKKRRERPTQQGLLGIGAKPAKGLETVELGAWGKSDMRKNAKGEGFFTPVMLEDRRTGERITEEEFERRKKAATNGGTEAEGWRARRDRNLEGNGRGSDRASGDDRGSGSSRKRTRNGRDRDRDRDRDRTAHASNREHDSSRSRRERSRSRDRPRRSEYRDHNENGDRSHRRHRDDQRDRDYDLNTSRHRGGERHRSRDRDSGREYRRN